MTFSPDYALFPGINYFWISLQLKPGSSLLSVIDVEMISAMLDSKEAPLAIDPERAPHHLGIGVRHTGDDGVAAYRIPGLVTTREGTLLAVYDVRYNNSGEVDRSYQDERIK